MKHQKLIFSLIAVALTAFALVMFAAPRGLAGIISPHDAGFTLSNATLEVFGRSESSDGNIEDAALLARLAAWIREAKVTYVDICNGVKFDGLLYMLIMSDPGPTLLKSFSVGEDWHVYADNAEYKPADEFVPELASILDELVAATRPS